MRQRAWASPSVRGYFVEHVTQCEANQRDPEIDFDDPSDHEAAAAAAWEMAAMG